MNEWNYYDPWVEEDIEDGSNAGFVYIIQFETGVYIGSKQIYQRVKDSKKIKESTKTYDWESYTGSSNVVNQRIADGEEYTKTILWCFPTMRETLLVESILILHQMLKPECLNIAMMNKVRSPNANDKRRLHGIVQELLEVLG